MDEKDQKIIEKEIPGKDHAGYAYIYPLSGIRLEDEMVTMAKYGMSL